MITAAHDLRHPIGPMTQNEIHATVLTFFRRKIVFNDTWQIPDDASFLGTGTIDSTGILELIGFLEDTYGITFRDDELVAANFDSLGRVSGFIAERLNGVHHGQHPA